MQQSYTQIFQAGAALIVVLGLIGLAARVARQKGLAKTRIGHKRLSIQDTVALDRARHLYIVRCDGRDLLMMVGGGKDISLGWLPVETAK